MKRLFTLLFAVVMTAISAMATDFTGKLTIDLGTGSPKTSTTTVKVEEATDKSYTLVLKDFSFDGLLIGTITLEGIPSTKDGNKVIFSEYTGTGKITDGKFIATALGNKVSVTIKEGSYMEGEDLHLILYIPVKYGFVDVKVNATFQSDYNPTGISTPHVATKTSTTIYTLDGQQVGSMTSGQVYIVKTTDGKTKKIIKK